ADQLELLRLQRGAFGGSPAAVVQLTSFVLQLVGTAVLLARLDARLLLLPVFGIPSLLTSARAEIMRQRAIQGTAENVRRARHLFELATMPAPAKELRIFGL